jgi:hypothetical protein
LLLPLEGGGRVGVSRSGLQEIEFPKFSPSRQVLSAFAGTLDP